MHDLDRSINSLLAELGALREENQSLSMQLTESQSNPRLQEGTKGG